jgi:hypothetical protein
MDVIENWRCYQCKKCNVDVAKVGGDCWSYVCEKCLSEAIMKLNTFSQILPNQFQEQS